MLIFVTNRKLCRGDFLDRIDRLAKEKPFGIMLREKDLNLAEYEALAVAVREICDARGVPLIINQNVTVAVKLHVSHVHLSMANLRKHARELATFSEIGASVHSVSEAVEAVRLGASYLVAGHIFLTDCKKGIPPRGLSFLKEVCDAVPTVPVFGIGGITRNKVAQVLAATGAKGACIMSEAMQE